MYLMMVGRGKVLGSWFLLSDWHHLGRAGEQMRKAALPGSPLRLVR